MNIQLIYLFAFQSLLLVLIGITHILHQSFKLNVEQSRKFLHVSGGFVCLLLPRFFQSHWWVLILSSAAFLLLFVTYQRKMLKAVHETRRHSVGSIIFPIPVYVCFLWSVLSDNFIYFYLPISLLTLADTAAETSGNLWGHYGKQFFHGQKTLVGTIAFFVIALFVCGGWFVYFSDDISYNIIVCIIAISALTAVTELVTLHGWDNLTVPLITNVLLWIVIK